MKTVDRAGVYLRIPSRARRPSQKQIRVEAPAARHPFRALVEFIKSLN